jgi:ABC-2 type transport system permease protein
MMLRGLWTLTWLEIKIFVREPLGLIGTVGFPVLIFILLGRMFGRSTGAPPVVSVDLPIFVSILMSLSAVLSQDTIISINREGGILKRLRSTPLRPHTNLTAHVLDKLSFTA